VISRPGDNHEHRNNMAKPQKTKQINVLQITVPKTSVPLITLQKDFIHLPQQL
jgi:hypothetical protein